MAGGRVESGWRGGLGADAGLSPDDGETADAVEVDGGGSPFEPVAGFGEDATQNRHTHDGTFERYVSWFPV